MCYFRCCKNHFITQTSLKVFFLIWAVVSPRSRSSDDLLDIDFSQTSFASSADSLTSGSQRNSFQLSQNGASNIGEYPVTYKLNYAGKQVTQCDFQNKGFVPVQSDFNLF